MIHTKDYQSFLLSKQIVNKPSGIPASLESISHSLFDWQRKVVQWALGKGKAALFEGCGLGKTAQQLEWARHVCIYTGGDVIILAPLAVAEQTKREGDKFGIAVNVCRSQTDVRPGINVTNYEMMEHFDPQHFAGVVLDESSLLKSYTSVTRQELTGAFSKTPYRLACTATPAPNDHMELGNHAEFLGVMRRTEMLFMFFVHDGGDTSKWRLKGHAESVFWKWVCSWSVMIQKPSDIGFSDHGFILPRLNRHQHTVSLDRGMDGYLFTPDRLTLPERRDVRRASLDSRVAKCAETVNATDEQFVIWCDYNDESTALAAAIDGAVEVTGSDSREFKTQAALGFIEGKIKRLVSKPSIFGYGMNMQICHNVAFVGLSDSFEQIYQAERRCWRFGQQEEVNVHIFTSDGDGPVVRNIQRKEREYEKMIDGMVEHMRSEMERELTGTCRQNTSHHKSERHGDGWTMHNGDCVDVVSGMPDESVDMTIFSPPFSSLYTYSSSDQDMGNSRSDKEFAEHFSYLVKELFRVTRSGRIVAFHCMNIPAMKERDGYIGIKDFRGDLIRLFQNAGFIFHSEHVIWKDPLIEATRTKAIGLMHKQLCKDSSISRAGLPDYLIAMRKPGENTNPIRHPDGLTSFAGENPPKSGTLSHERWRRYASPVWMDIDQSNTLNGRLAREDADERHVCPLQLDVIERALTLWSADDDVVLSPFAGIGSEGYQAVKMGREFIGIELKESYFFQACSNLAVAETSGREQHGLFDLPEAVAGK